MLKNFISKLAESQVNHPKKYVIIVLITALLAGLCCLKLTFDSSYEALLPVDSPKLKMTDQVRDLTGGFRQLVLAIEGDSLGRLEFAQNLSTELTKIPEISRVELKQPLEFFSKRAIWLLPTTEVIKLTEALDEAIEESIAAQDPMGLGLISQEEAQESEKEAWKNVNDLLAGYQKQVPYKSPYQISSDGRYLFMTAIPSIKFSDMKAAIDLLSKIKTSIAQLDPASHGIQVKMAGNLAIVEEQHKTMSRDLTSAAVLALILSIILVAVFTKKPSAPLLVGLSLITGIAWTMAITALSIGHLNIITGFLVSVIVGLGIDFSVHIYIRYQQELAKSPAEYKPAMVKTVEGTFFPAMIAAMTTVGTFFAFYFAEFRGFSEFGLIAALGVALSFVAAFLLLPPLLVMFDRQVSVKKSAPKKTYSLLTYSRAWVIVIASVSLAVFGIISLQSIEFKNDYKNLRGQSEATAFLDYVDQEMGASLSPTVFIFDSIEDSRKAAAIIREEAKNSQPDDLAKILKVAGAADLVPLANDEQRKAIADLRDLLDNDDLDEALENDPIRSQQLAMAREMLSSESWDFSQLPPELQHRFSTAKGGKYMLYLWPHQRYEADYQAAAWEKILEKLSARLNEQHIPHLMADETLILAWVYQLILKDSPWVIGLAALVTLCFLILDFRSPKKTLLVALPLVLGMAMVFGMMRIFGLSLNMFNIIVLPSIIGIGIDNAIHIYHRYEVMGKGQLDQVLRSTGVASFLASITTIIGFGSSLISHMPGLRSLGELAIVGLSLTFVSAVIFFPAMLRIFERK